MILLSFLLLLSLAAPAQTEWLEFNAGTQGHTSPLIQYNGTWDDLLSFDVEVPDLLADTVEVDSVRYLRVSSSPGLTVSDSTGYPEMPVVRCFVWVPDNTDLTLSWAANCPQATASIPIYPAPLDSLREDSTSTPFIEEFFRKDSAAYVSEQWYPDTLAKAMGQFNLLGDPAVDVGDRVKFPDHCDLIISPGDLAVNRYPTRAIGQGGEIELYATVRNAGGAASGLFDVELSVTAPGQMPQTLTAACRGLDPGEEETLAFTWSTSWAPSGQETITLAAEADPDGDCSDSWRPNNSAETQLEIVDLYPNEEGWPVLTGGSVTHPPMLVDLDADGELEVVAVCGMLLAAYEPAGGPPIWEVAAPTVWEAVPVAGNVCGDNRPEIVVETSDELIVINGAGEVVGSWVHSIGHDLRTPVLADLEAEQSGGAAYEIAMVIDESLYVLDFDAQGDLFEAASVELFDPLPGSWNCQQRSWLVADDVQGSALPELMAWMYWWNNVEPGQEFYKNGVFVYDHGTGEVVEERIEENGEGWHGIPALGPLAGDTLLALPRGWATADHAPAWVLDPNDLSTPVTCRHNPSRDSYFLKSCMMADWTVTPGLDRIIAPAENQCFVWDRLGDEAWFSEYENETGSRPPFGALGDLDNDGNDDLIVATREGSVMGYDFEGNDLDDLGFPYTLPSEVYGGFVIADIDNDEKVEVVFGTMDNYLHVWELGSCYEGYAPWPQCQHDAQRTGVLE